MPGDTPSPSTTRSFATCSAISFPTRALFLALTCPVLHRPERQSSSVFLEPGLDDLAEHLDGILRLAADGGDLDLGARPGSEHHQPEDRPRRNRRATLRDGDLGIEPRRELDELGGGPSVQATPVGDHRGIPENVSVTAVVDHPKLTTPLE